MPEATADRRGNEMRPIRIQKAEKNKKRGNRGGIYLLAFLFPVLIFTLGFALKGVYPFGENSALVVDGVHQYTAFYRELSEQLGKGAGWTWSDIEEYKIRAEAIQNTEIFMDCFAIISAVRSASWYCCL